MIYYIRCSEFIGVAMYNVYTEKRYLVLGS